ncbi:MAG: hypothetical protein M3Z05_11550 [Gemmatimonadota bacterium]|nr:hypothetical protein [Gemmatimonadota bacterium]
MEGLFSGAHPHLLVNHAPVMGALFALALLVASWLFAPDVLRRTAFVVLVGTALAAAACDLTGDPAEHAVEGLPGVSRQVVHAHTDMAGKAYTISIVVGVLAIGALIRWRRMTIPTGVTVVMLLASAFLSGAMGYTALLGGRVRHTEVRPGAVAADAMVVEPPRRGRP